MSILKKHENKLKTIIKNDHEGKFYSDNDLREIINSIIISVKKDCDLEDESITTFVTQYLYCGKDGKYFFNFKRRQTKKREYHHKILNSVKDDSLQKESNNEGFCLTRTVTETIKLDAEPTSEELLELEKEIFAKVESKQAVFHEPTINNKQIIEEPDYGEYQYPSDYKFKYVRPTTDLYGPYGTQWYHDEQYDDILDENAIKYSKQFDVLRAIKLPEQRTPEWFKMRDGKITASDGGTVIDLNSHEKQYSFILKKTLNPPFLSNEFVHHGKKYEDVATMIYEYRMNVSTDEFGLIGHPKYDFLGASPDRICNKYKLDGIHKSKFIGRMLEIKCPYVRKIKMSGPIIDNICPIYYWVQVQLQLECCDLEECDFWQCELKEYESRNEFIEDTDPNEPFKSRTTKFEKGCIIQLLPKRRMQDIINGNYKTVVEEDSKYIFAPKIEMSPYECDVWVTRILTELPFDPKYNDYFFDKVLYWKLVTSKCVLINRDRKWFEENLPTMQRVWNYVLFFRENKDKLKILVDYIESRPKKMNKDIMNVIEKLYKKSDPSYNKQIELILKSIEDTKLQNEIDLKEREENNGYMFIDESSESQPIVAKKTYTPNPYKKIFIKANRQQTNNDNDYHFI
jgi:putative phage-type endonuclease